MSDDEGPMIPPTPATEDDDGMEVPAPGESTVGEPVEPASPSSEPGRIDLDE